VKLWDAASGRELRAWQREGFPNRVAFSPDGRRLASLGREAVTVWDVESGEELLAGRHPDADPGAVAFTPDGARLVGAVGRDVRIWDASDGRVLKTLKGHSQAVDHLAVSRDGRRIVSGGGSLAVLSAPADCEVRVWDADSGQELLTLSGHTSPIRGVAISPDGLRIVSCSGAEARGQMLRLWDATPRNAGP
jgi:WD40 repeat protein